MTVQMPGAPICGDPVAGRREGNRPTRPAQSNRTMIPCAPGNDRLETSLRVASRGRDGGNQGSNSAEPCSLWPNRCDSLAVISISGHSCVRACLAGRLFFAEGKKERRKKRLGCHFNAGRAHAVRTAAKQQAVCRSILGHWRQHGSG